jgi:hypothetical protein
LLFSEKKISPAGLGSASDACVGIAARENRSVIPVLPSPGVGGGARRGEWVVRDKNL